MVVLVRVRVMCSCVWGRVVSVWGGWGIQYQGTPGAWTLVIYFYI